jgi:hypothetical protein
MTKISNFAVVEWYVVNCVVTSTASFIHLIFKIVQSLANITSAVCGRYTSAVHYFVRVWLFAEHKIVVWQRDFDLDYHIGIIMSIDMGMFLPDCWNMLQV